MARSDNSYKYPIHPISKNLLLIHLTIAELNFVQY
jgi:hypothetical protein